MDNININNVNSFLSITGEEIIETQIRGIIANNENEYNKLNDSIRMLSEVLNEEKYNKNIIKNELDYIKSIQVEAEGLFSKIINLSAH